MILRRTQHVDVVLILVCVCVWGRGVLMFSIAVIWWLVIMFWYRLDVSLLNYLYFVVWDTVDVVNSLQFLLPVSSFNRCFGAMALL